MTNISAANESIGERPDLSVSLQQALQSRIRLLEAEIDSFEQRDADLQTHIKECRERRDSADAIRQRMLQGISAYGQEEVRSAFDDYTAAISEVARRGQRLQQVTAHRRGGAKGLATERAQ